MQSWAERLYAFYTSLQPTQTLPNGVHWLYPFQRPEVREVLQAFLTRFYNDDAPRRLLLGINPGRFGAGVTGINFTAPKQLSEDCGIAHPFPQGSELSAEFIYTVIRACGGPSVFYRRFFIGAVCPLGFVKDGKNLNYYDDPALLQAVEPFIVQSINTQLQWPVDRSRCFCIGGDKNFRQLQRLNQREGWFGEIVPLPHPRFVMQYRRKQTEAYVHQYLDALQKN